MPQLSDYIPKIEKGGIEGDFRSNYAWMPFDSSSKLTTGNVLWNLSEHIHKFFDHITNTSKYYQNSSGSILIGPARKGIVVVSSFATYAHIEPKKMFNLVFISDHFQTERQNAISNILKTAVRYSDIIKYSINVTLPPKIISSEWLVDVSRSLLSKIKIKDSTSLIAYTPTGIAIASCMCLLLYKENGTSSKISLIDIKNNGADELAFSPEISNKNDVLLINSDVNNNFITGMLDPKCHHIIMDDSVRDARTLLDVSLLLIRNGVTKNKISSIMLFNHSEYGPIQASNLGGIPLFSLTSTKKLIGAKHSDNKSINNEAHKELSKEYYWKRYNAKTRATLIELGVLLNEGRTCLTLKRLNNNKKEHDSFWWSLYSECLRILACKLYTLGTHMLVHSNFNIARSDILFLSVSLAKRLGILEAISYLNGGSFIVDNFWMNGKNLSHKTSKAFLYVQNFLSKSSMDEQIKWACRIQLEEKNNFINSSLTDLVSCICRGNILSQSALHCTAYSLNICSNDHEVIMQHATNNWIAGEYSKCISILQELRMEKNSSASVFLDYILNGKNINLMNCIIGIRKSGKNMVHYDWQ